MHRPSSGDPHRTSNISHNTQQKRKSVTETRNVLLLTKGIPYLNSLKLHVSCIILARCGVCFFHMVTDCKRISAVQFQHNEMSFLPLYISLLNLDCLLQASVRVCESESLCNCVWVWVKTESDPPDSALHARISKKHALVFINWTRALLKFRRSLEEDKVKQRKERNCFGHEILK